MSEDKIYRVKANDNAWNVAKNNLQNSGDKSISNDDIINEMSRLAKINQCKDYNEFNNKYFKKVGQEFKLESETPKTVVKSEKKEVDFISEKSKKEESNTFLNKLQENWSKLINPKGYFETKEVEKINKMPDDKSRIIEYNQNKATGNYVIIDKKSCKAFIYNKNGEVLKELSVGVGKAIGDKRHSGLMLKSDDPRREQGRYTTPGEFVLDQYETPVKNYGKRVMALKGDNRGEFAAQPAIHMIPENHKERIPLLKNDKDGKIDDNRMSYGCVNLLKEDYDLFSSLIKDGNKVYILPEEDGNKLQLEKQKDGNYKFVQQKYKSAKHE